MWFILLVRTEVWRSTVPTYLAVVARHPLGRAPRSDEVSVPGLRAGGDVQDSTGRGLRPGAAGNASCAFGGSLRVRVGPADAALTGGSALTLLVASVLADHHDPAVAADHLALVADLLDARLNLHLPAVFGSAS